MGKQYHVALLAGSSRTNHVYLGIKTLDMVRCDISYQYYLVRSNNGEFIFRGEYSSQLKQQECSFSTVHQNLLKVNKDSDVTIIPTELHSYKPITALTIEIKPLSKDEIISINTEQFLKYFKDIFSGLIITEKFRLILEIKDASFICEVSDFKFDKGEISKHGVLMGMTHLTCKENDRIKIKQSTKDQSLFKSGIDLHKMGIGGLSEEFAIIFRRLFASRLVPRKTMNEMNISHIRGMIIHGPPGCGKTLLARQIGKLLNCAKPKVVNGPELLNMYVGESESNTRKLFEDAINDRECKELHLIICDEFDALSRHRGMTTHNNPVHDNVVTTLLSYIDGINQLNNILLICMTNRIDLIDSALLRPGRLELQIEISLPDLNGRTEILNIHMATMKSNRYLDKAVDINELAIRTKNFTGAEIEGLVKCASSYAITRTIDTEQLKMTTNPTVMMGDFIKAFNEIKPMFGNISTQITEITGNEMIFWHPEIIRQYRSIIDRAQKLTSGHSLSIVIDGQPYSGKTFMSAHLVEQLCPSYARIIDPMSVIDKNEQEKCRAIRQVYDNAEKSEFSMIILDTFERLIEWCPIGMTLNNQILQVILTLLRKNIKSNNKLVTLMTCYDAGLLKKLEVDNLFDLHFTMPHRIDAKSAKMFNYETQEEAEISVVLHQHSKV
jgi:vesicle-fusing ATPase